MERVIISDITSIHICTSSKWGTLEKKVINDCLFLRDSGANPIIVCVKGSFLDKYATKEDIERIYTSPISKSGLTDLNYYFKIRKILFERAVDLIHCYHIEAVWMAALCAKRFVKVPLILTSDSIPEKKISGFHYRWLGKRIDSVLCFSLSDKELFSRLLPIPKHKMNHIGLGIEVSKNYTRPENSKRVIGCFIQRNFTFSDILERFLMNIEKIKTICLEREIDVGFHLFFEDGMEESEIYEQIHSLLKEHHLLDTVHMASVTSFSQVLTRVNLFFSINNYEVISFEEMTAIIGQKLVLFPRTSARVDLIAKYGKVAQTYSPDNGFEMVKKLMYLIENERVFWKTLQTQRRELLEEHGAEQQVRKFYDIYSSQIQIRSRENIAMKIS
jgi:hypothetical protein